MTYLFKGIGRWSAGGMLALCFLLSADVTFAQRFGRNPDQELGAHMGVLLPDQIQGVTEIMPFWGLRQGWKLGRGFGEVGGMFSRANDSVWYNLHLTYRADFEIEHLVAMVYLGADGHMYLPAGAEDYELTGGGHVGSGLMTWILDNVWFRADMKVNLTPGVGLYVGFGLTLRN